MGLEVYSVYLTDDIGVAGENVGILEILGAILLCSTRAWVVQGDWNVAPDALALSGWVERVNGVTAAPDSPTCLPSQRSQQEGGGGDHVVHDEGGRILECFVVSKAIASCVGEVQVVSEAPLFPHSPVALRMRDLGESTTVDQQVRFKPFDMT
eukprot:1820299-Pyramimonas_sp.AAC.1